ncbi:MAG: indolepyruvate oxidoreductase subunit beta family protein [Parvularculaceae bacterium]
MSVRPIKIAVMALGGQGGGVLADWIVKAGERAGHIAQSTSVPGVAQRTGATIYYVELFPRSEAEKQGKEPVLALMPAPGDVDILLAAEMMEAGRALTRGFLSSQTTLIASAHRIYAIGEKIAMSDGRQDTDAVRREVDAAVGRAVWFDMEKTAEDAGAVISAVMLGALAGSGASPIAREIFEEEIRAGGRAVERNLKGFSFGFDAAAAGAPPASARQSKAPPAIGVGAARAVKPLVDRLASMPEAVRSVAYQGLKKVVDHQDARYGALYLDRLERFLRIDAARNGADLHMLSSAVAKYLALAMAYDDVVRVADQKTRRSRFARFREDVRAPDDQIVRVWEFMHPRPEEICDMLPPAMARPLLASRQARGFLSIMLGGGRRVATTNVSGFLMLNAIASLRFMRRASSRYQSEQARIDDWLALIEKSAGADYAFACEIAALQRLIKGYGDTHARGLSNYGRIIAALDQMKQADDPAKALRRVRDAAMSDENGDALQAALMKIGGSEMAAA